MLWALGMILLGLSSTTSPEVPADPNARRIQPWRIILYWLGPLSPPIHFIVLLFWGAMIPPLPAYVLAGCAVLLLYMALRIGLVSSVSKHLGQEREESARVMEQGRLLYELHDTAKQEVHGISLTLQAALDAERRGDREGALEMFGRALSASREAEFRISRPYDELSAMRGESPPGAADFLRQRLRKFEEYFGVKTHDDTQAPIDVLNPAETAALIRVFVEAFWNVAKHSGASNLYLESRRVGSVLIIRVRDDGHGFDTGKPPPGLSLEYMRRVGRSGTGRDLHSWTRYFGAGKVPQAPEHRQPLAGRLDRLHEAEQNVVGKRKELPRDGAHHRRSGPAYICQAGRGLTAILCGCVRSSGW